MSVLPIAIGVALAATLFGVVRRRERVDAVRARRQARTWPWLLGFGAGIALLVAGCGLLFLGELDLGRLFGGVAIGFAGLRRDQPRRDRPRRDPPVTP